MGDALHSTVRVATRRWPCDPTIAHLVLLDLHMVPTESDVDDWIAAAFAPGVQKVRTGALFPESARIFADRGFVVADRLALLERHLHPTDAPPRPRRPSRDVDVRRLRTRDLSVAAGIDAASFPTGWRNDASSLDDIRHATPTARGRIVRVAGRPAAFALTGRAGPTGYLQRFAVTPESRRGGLGALLVDDAVRWLCRRGATNALVNTGIDNVAALALYERTGFERRPDELVVMELSR